MSPTVQWNGSTSSGLCLSVADLRTSLVLGGGIAYGLQTGLALGVVGVAIFPTERRSAGKAP